MCGVHASQGEDGTVTATGTGNAPTTTTPALGGSDAVTADVAVEAQPAGEHTSKAVDTPTVSAEQVAREQATTTEAGDKPVAAATTAGSADTAVASAAAARTRRRRAVVMMGGGSSDPLAGLAAAAAGKVASPPPSTSPYVTVALCPFSALHGDRWVRLTLLCACWVAWAQRQACDDESQRTSAEAAAVVKAVHTKPQRRGHQPAPEPSSVLTHGPAADNARVEAA